MKTYGLSYLFQTSVDTVYPRKGNARLCCCPPSPCTCAVVTYWCPSAGSGVCVGAVDDPKEADVFVSRLEREVTVVSELE